MNSYLSKACSSLTDEASGCFFAISIRPLPFFVSDLWCFREIECFHGLVSVKIPFSKTYYKRRQFHFSLRYPKQFLDMWWMRACILLCVYIIVSVWAGAPLWWVLAMGCQWLAMSFWLPSVFLHIQDEREGLVWHWFPVWFSPSHLGQNFRLE